MRFSRLIVFPLALALCAACSAAPSIFIDKNGGGRVEFHLRLEKPFVDYLVDIGLAGGMFPSADKAVIFDLPLIRKKLSQFPGVTVTRLSAATPGALDLAFTFKSLDTFAKAGDLSPSGTLLTVSGAERKTIRLRLDKATINKILTAFINVKGSEVEYFLPRAGETKQDYYDNLDFALDSGSVLFKKSAVDFLVTVDGAVSEHNGSLKSPSSVQFTVPLETTLFLDKPVEYFIVYQ